MRLPGDGVWLGLREVTRLNGKFISGESTELLTLLKRPAGARGAQAAAISRRNARHNLGYPRTTNMPTLPLELRHPRNLARHAFQRDGSEIVNGRLVARVSFAERARPTLIKSPDGTIELLTCGIVWMEPETGRFLRVQVEAFEPRDPTWPEWTLTVMFGERTDRPCGCRLNFRSGL
jgi:hypothetical protein